MKLGKRSELCGGSGVTDDVSCRAPLRLLELNSSVHATVASEVPGALN